MTNPLSHLKSYRIILASASPRRQELLKMLDIDFEVNTSIPVDEHILPQPLPEDVAPAIAAVKAQAYKVLIKSNELIITADTVVLVDGRVLGKPSDEIQAKQMLQQLSGKTHKVITGVTVTSTTESKTIKAISEVEFAPLTSAEIDYYIDTYKPFDKAGAYGIQEWIGAAAIKSIKGSFYNVMGLPVHQLYALLKTF